MTANFALCSVIIAVRVLKRATSAVTKNIRIWSHLEGTVTFAPIAKHLTLELSQLSSVCQWSYHFDRAFVSGAITMTDRLSVKLSLLSSVWQWSFHYCRGLTVEPSLLSRVWQWSYLYCRGFGSWAITIDRALGSGTITIDRALGSGTITIAERLAVELSLWPSVWQWSYHYDRAFGSRAITITERLAVELSLYSCFH